MLECVPPISGVLTLAEDGSSEGTGVGGTGGTVEGAEGGKPLLVISVYSGYQAGTLTADKAEKGGGPLAPPVYK